MKELTECAKTIMVCEVTAWAQGRRSLFSGRGPMLCGFRGGAMGDGMRVGSMSYRQGEN
jgi:hypothetical protein